MRVTIMVKKLRLNGLMRRVTEDNVHEIFADVDGIFVPGGFGIRGIEGKILACQYAREK